MHVARHVGLLATVLLSCFMATRASYYDDMLMEDLYKRLSALENSYNLDEDEAMGGQSDWLTNDIALDSRGEADIRDSEYLQHGASKGGFQYISGGAGEGSQHLTPEGTQNNTQEVKSDESLPFYCHPPNPCPKGFKEEDGCQLSVQDTAEAQRDWIYSMMKHQLCSCDEEHMFSCPKDMDTMNSEKGHDSRDQLDDVIDNLFTNNDPADNPYLGGNKRDSLMAKKMMQRRMEEAAAYEAENPFISGDRIHTVAKKGLQYQDM